VTGGTGLKVSFFFSSGCSQGFPLDNVSEEVSLEYFRVVEEDRIGFIAFPPENHLLQQLIFRRKLYNLGFLPPADDLIDEIAQDLIYK
jgi:hypothetical protein